MKILGTLFRWLFAILLMLLVVALLVGHAWLQAAFLTLAVAGLLFWPMKYLSARWNQTTASWSRLGFVLAMLAGFMVIPSGTKDTIYRSEKHRKAILDIYDKKVAKWPADVEDIYVETDYGKVHVLACGKPENPPVLLLHAASMGAPSWAENLPPLLDHFRIFAIDNIGEGNKSELKNAMVFPLTPKELADLYAGIADSLGVERCPVFGASNGGFIAMNLAYYYPEKVESLLLMGPMGLTQISNKSILTMALSSMYPFPFVRKYTTRFAIGDDPGVLEKYGDWFDAIISGSIPSIAQPVPMTTAQKQAMSLPVLLFLGTKDPIVGDAAFAKETAGDFPTIQIEVLESGHLVGVEKASYVNAVVASFFDFEEN
ncbi:MAG: alpha/beta hydrolase [Lewinellaceae bacterium]|nr:alpha/beta hydrolase [Lewinellaceae bacterium]